MKEVFSEPYYFSEMTESEKALFFETQYILCFSDKETYDGPDGNTYRYCKINSWWSSDPDVCFNVYEKDIDFSNYIEFAEGYETIVFQGFCADLKQLEIIKQRCIELGYKELN